MSYPLSLPFSSQVHVCPYFSDFLGYIVQLPDSNDCFLVDVATREPFTAAVNKLGLTVKFVLTTHKHMDHQVQEKEFEGENIPIYKSKYEPTTGTQDIGEGQIIEAGGLTIQGIHTPTHTKGHICYLVTDSKGRKIVFTGDHLFTGGCGRFFEGDARTMVPSIEKLFSTCGTDAVMLPGHHYAVGNLKFAKSVEPDNQDVNQMLDRLNKEGSAQLVPTTLEQELLINPFVRCVFKHEEISQAMHTSKDKTTLLQELRMAKDNF
eukprot:Protomagalhaensia_wolfi_Nauph_80__5014@NODE_530_length_2368_cov_652_792615_g395_i0_p2_GENE_NODE_530_length_2368_cov_652_792615_g395_i0NODE_530_length_2368_cov_652_792615_g395_i0_p2_ORF_typecomplete_len263_score44_18Lactamase_B/PF00753_27/7_1e20HAGH_C/PF16123_5/1_5e17Lactamase_B_3/PF13483_6/3_1e06Lactamase_B_2/PF12706_7/4_1e06Lactamase_B_5/PF14597_6/5_9e05_NODE_530_length_2368_cov_652_792615_g395_i010751863